MVWVDDNGYDWLVGAGLDGNEGSYIETTGML
jgi:hypothetical protein